MQETKPAESTQQIDLTNYVPKSDYDKLQAETSETKKGLASLKDQLLDKDYLEFLESRKNPQSMQTQKPITQADIRNMDTASLVKLVNDTVLATMNQALTPVFQAVNTRLTNMEAGQEVNKVAGDYEDFNDYRDDVAAILEKAPNDITIEQAYLMAKASRAPEAPAPSNVRQPARSERPGTIIPLSGDTVKTFKSSEEAANAAAAEVLARHGIQGDTI